MNKKNNYTLLIFMMITMLTASCFTSCSNDDGLLNKNSEYKSLFSKTDYFIDMLDKIYERYDALGSKSTKTSDGKWTVTPMGRLIIVKNNRSSSSVEYNNVRDALSDYYKSNYKVKDVYINKNGTVTIDCRK